MTDDLAQRLRFVLAMSDFNKRQATVNEAADRIDALTAERDRLREALRSVIDMDEHGVWHGGVMSQARAALADPEPTEAP